RRRVCRAPPGTEVARGVQVGGLVDVPTELLGVHDAQGQPQAFDLGGVARQGVGTVGELEAGCGGHRHDVRAATVAVGHQDDDVGIDPGEQVEIGREGQVTVGDHDSFDALVGQAADRPGDGGAQVEPGGPADLG